MTQTFVLSVCTAVYCNVLHKGFCDEWELGQTDDYHSSGEHITIVVQAPSKEALLDSLYHNLLFVLENQGNISFRGRVQKWMQCDSTEYGRVDDPVLSEIPYLKLLAELFFAVTYISASEDTAIRPHALWNDTKTDTCNHHFVLDENDVWLDLTKLKTLIRKSVRFYDISNIADFV